MNLFRQVVAAGQRSALVVWVSLACLTCHAGDVPTQPSSPSPLADAAERSDVKGVDTLLAAHCDGDAAQPDGMTALLWATYHDDCEMVKSLVAAGADVKRANQYDVAPLLVACQNGNKAIVKLLLETGADANTKGRGDETALMFAARTGRVEVVDELLTRGAYADAKSADKQTAMMWAAAEGHADVVRALLSAGADFRTPLDSGFTPLLFAVREGHIEVVKVLIEAGADVNEAIHPDRKVTGRPGEGFNPLVMAVENGHFELAKALLDAGADPNDQRSGFTALHVISWVRKPDSGDDNGQPAPEGSGKLTSIDMVRQLAAHGADVNARLKRGDSGPAKLSRKGATPFLMAADTADVPLMHLLVELGADPSIPNAFNATPLMAAAGLGTLAPTEEAGTEEEGLEAIQYTLDLGGDVNAVDDNGETAMHGAAYASWPKMVHFLTEHGAKESTWNHKNKYKWSPLIIAQGHRPGNFKPSPDTIEALLSVAPDLANAADEEPAKDQDEYK